MGLYIKTSAGAWSSVVVARVKTGASTMSTVIRGFVKTAANAWSQFWPATVFVIAVHNFAWRITRLHAAN